MVYVDDMMAPYRNMVMCHLIADTTAELYTMVDLIGVQRRWVQFPNTYKEHFDICLSKRTQALAAGAIPITWRELGAKMNARRKNDQGHQQVHSNPT